MPPLQSWYLPLYIRTGVVGLVRKTDTYQLLDVADAHLDIRPATEMDTEKGSTPQPNRRPLPLALSDSARASGLVYLYPGPRTSYRNGPLHAYLRRCFYDGRGVATVLRWPIIAGLASFLGLLGLATRKDIERLKELKCGRLLKGPVLVSPKGFNRAIKGDGVGFRTVEFKQLMRIPQRAEGQHIELMGDTGAGKTRLIMQLLLQIIERGVTRLSCTTLLANLSSGSTTRIAVTSSSTRSTLAAPIGGLPKSCVAAPRRKPSPCLCISQRPTRRASFSRRHRRKSSPIC